MTTDYDLLNIRIQFLMEKDNLMKVKETQSFSKTRKESRSKNNREKEQKTNAESFEYVLARTLKKKEEWIKMSSQVFDYLHI